MTLQPTLDAKTTPISEDAASKLIDQAEANAAEKNPAPAPTTAEDNTQAASNNAAENNSTMDTKVSGGSTNQGDATA